MGNEVTVGVLQAILRLKDELTPALQGATAKIGQVGSTVAGIGSTIGKVFAAEQFAEGFAKVTEGIEGIVEKGSRIADMAGRMGITAEAVQKLSQAARLGGASMESVSNAIRVMSDHISDGKLPKSLTEMGISLDALRKMTPDQAFLTLAEAIQKIPDPMKQSAAAMDVFGRGGQQLLPAIRDGFADVAKQAPTMSNELIASLDRLGDNMLKLQDRMEIFKANALGPIFDLFDKLPGPLQTSVAVFISLVPLLTNLGIAFVALGGTGAMLLPFLGPAGWLILAVVAIYEAWQHWDWIAAFFKGAFAYVVDTIKKMPDWLGLLLGPIGLVLLAFKHWDEIKTFVMNVHLAVKEWLVDKFLAIINGVRDKVAAVTGFFKDMYDKVVGHSYVPDMIKGIQSEFSKLQSAMVMPTSSATKTVEGLFSSLKDNALKGLKELGSGLKEMFSPSGIMNSLMTSGINFVMDKASQLLQKGLSALGRGIQSLFGTDEEARDVNPARDQFFQGFQNQFGGDQQASLATALMNAGVTGDVADRLIQGIYKADTMKEFESATKAVNDALHKGTETSTADGAKLTDVSAASTAAMNALIAAIQSLTQTIASSIAAMSAAVSQAPPPYLPISAPSGELQSIPSFANGSNGYQDFKGGTLAVLHGREKVVTEGGDTPTLSINIGDIHVGAGDAPDVRRAAAMGVLDALERGGPAWQKFRILATQAVG